MGRITKYVETKRIDNRRLQRERSRRTLRRLTAAFFLGCVLVGGMIFSGWVRWRQRETVFHINVLLEEQERLLEEQKRLRMSISQLSAPERIARIAKEKLGMEPIGRDRIVKVVPAEEHGSAMAADTRGKAGSENGGGR